jgi:hypothetical protein
MAVGGSTSASAYTQQKPVDVVGTQTFGKQTGVAYGDRGRQDSSAFDHMTDQAQQFQSSSQAVHTLQSGDNGPTYGKQTGVAYGDRGRQNSFVFEGSLQEGGPSQTSSSAAYAWQGDSEHVVSVRPASVISLTDGSVPNNASNSSQDSYRKPLPQQAVARRSTSPINLTDGSALHTPTSSSHDSYRKYLPAHVVSSPSSQRQVQLAQQPRAEMEFTTSTASTYTNKAKAQPVQARNVVVQETMRLTDGHIASADDQATSSRMSYQKYLPQEYGRTSPTPAVNAMDQPPRVAMASATSSASAYTAHDGERTSAGRNIVASETMSLTDGHIASADDQATSSRMSYQKYLSQDCVRAAPAMGISEQQTSKAPMSSVTSSALVYTAKSLKPAAAGRNIVSEETMSLSDGYVRTTEDQATSSQNAYQKHSLQIYARPEPFAVTNEQEPKAPMSSITSSSLDYTAKSSERVERRNIVTAETMMLADGYVPTEKDGLTNARISYRNYLPQAFVQATPEADHDLIGDNQSLNYTTSSQSGFDAKPSYTAGDSATLIVNDAKISLTDGTNNPQETTSSRSSWKKYLPTEINRPQQVNRTAPGGAFVNDEIRSRFGGETTSAATYAGAQAVRPLAVDRSTAGGPVLDADRNARFDAQTTSRSAYMFSPSNRPVATDRSVPRGHILNVDVGGRFDGRSTTEMAYTGAQVVRPTAVDRTTLGGPILDAHVGGRFEANKTTGSTYQYSPAKRPAAIDRSVVGGPIAGSTEWKGETTYKHSFRYLQGHATEEPIDATNDKADRSSNLLTLMLGAQSTVSESSKAVSSVSRDAFSPDDGSAPAARASYLKYLPTEIAHRHAPTKPVEQRPEIGGYRGGRSTHTRAGAVKAPGLPAKRAPAMFIPSAQMPVVVGHANGDMAAMRTTSPQANAVAAAGERLNEYEEAVMAARRHRRQPRATLALDHSEEAVDYRPVSKSPNRNANPPSSQSQTSLSLGHSMAPIDLHPPRRGAIETVSGTDFAEADVTFTTNVRAAGIPQHGDNGITYVDTTARTEESASRTDFTVASNSTQVVLPAGHVLVNDSGLTNVLGDPRGLFPTSIAHADFQSPTKAAVHAAGYVPVHESFMLGDDKVLMQSLVHSDFAKGAFAENLAAIPAAGYKDKYEGGVFEAGAAYPPAQPSASGAIARKLPLPPLRIEATGPRFPRSNWREQRRKRQELAASEPYQSTAQSAYRGADAPPVVSRTNSAQAETIDWSNGMGVTHTHTHMHTHTGEDNVLSMHLDISG